MRGQCRRHEGIASAFACERCGDFRCAGCRRTLIVRDLCPRCHALEAREGSASYWSIGAAVLGFWGLGCAPLGWLGALLGLVALVLTAREGRRAGRGLAVIGVLLGVAGTFLLATALWSPSDSMGVFRQSKGGDLERVPLSP